MGMVCCEGWIFEENLFPVLSLLSSLCHYELDADDRAAVIYGVRDIDEKHNKWFRYFLGNESELQLEISMEFGTGIYSIQIESKLPIEQGIRTILATAQSYRLIERSCIHMQKSEDI